MSMLPSVAQNCRAFRVDVSRWTGIENAALRYDPQCGTLQPWRPRKGHISNENVPLWKPETNYEVPKCLYVIPNRRCNFHCEYCYAAETRDGAEMDAPVLDGLLEGFYRTKKEGDAVRIVFMGGGEPLLSLKLLEQGIRKSRYLEKEHGVRTALGLVTNGSLLTEAVEAMLVEGRVSVDVSFEVLKDVQEAQRGEYASVSENILRASQHLPISIRTVATGHNGMRITETAIECAKNYPNVRAWRCDPEIDATGRSFFRAYTLQFIEALKAADEGKWELKVENTATRCLEQPTMRFCYGLWVAGPTGKIVRCPSDDGTDHGLIGQFNSSGIDLLKRSLTVENDEPRPDPSKCSRCFLRWNCAGGCPARRQRSSSRDWDELCRSHRAVTAYLMAKHAEKAWGVDWTNLWGKK